MNLDQRELGALRTLLDDVTAGVARLNRSTAASLPGLGRLLEALTEAALVADNHGRYVWANTAACELTGYSAKELTRLSVWDLTPDAKGHEAERLWRTFLDQRGQSGEYALVTKDGRIVAALYAAQINLLPGLHVSLMRRKPHQDEPATNTVANRD